MESIDGKDREDLATPLDYSRHMRAEAGRALFRREKCAERPNGHEDCQWGLALSGGGIRSATFCFGVMQALSEAGLPGQPPVSPPKDEDAPEPSLMGQFDYLSTVSGGGYIGTFFLSLFVKNRARQPLSDEQAARLAHDALRADPPGRIRTRTVQAGSPATPGAWLRENARYLTPTSAGDMLYGMATMIRAWFAEQYVIGTFLLMLLSVLGLLKLGVFGLAAHHKMPEAFSAPAHGLWMSALWILPLLSAVVALIPCGCAFWMTYPVRGTSLNAPNSKRKGIVVGMVMLGVACFGLAYLLHARPEGSVLLIAVCVSIGWSALVMSLWYLITAAGKVDLGTVRVVLTRHLTRLLKITAALVYLAIVDTLAQTFYEWHALLPNAAIAIGASWLAHRFGPLLSQLGERKSKLRIPLGLVFGVLSLILVTVLLVFWDWVLLNIQWSNYVGVPAQPANSSTFGFQLTNLIVTLLLTTGLVLIVGRYPQFNNLSTLAGLYSARLTRAYQGASNAQRFAAPKTMSSAEPLESDHINFASYNENWYAPMHIINVCMNQNVDPAEQLVQRDRKGKPLAILPQVEHAAPMRFAIDGDLYEEPRKNPDVLTIGEWIGISGAAVSTGLGRQTTAATALLLGLANVRLGRWWRSGTPRSDEGKDRNRIARGFRAVLPTQAYLMDELLARFYGTRRKLQYLSDGGHFDNTGIYELLRDDRKVSLVVACDCGADSAYAFGDLANLIRLARIDFGIDIIVDHSVTVPISPLGKVFGTPEQLAAPTDADSTKCAILLHVFKSAKSRAQNKPDMKIVLIKPRVIASAPIDVHQYAGSNPTFPQQTTADQFFDEAQWESYRKLGLEIGKLVFGNTDSGYLRALKTHLL